MKIKKLGHCCLLIETHGVIILTDPGTYSTMQDEATGVGIILITHEHPDHFHLESLKKVIANNPAAKIITNTAVGRLLDAERISYEILEHGSRKTEQGVLLEGFGQKHAEIYETWGQVENTGYFIADKLFYPGDAFTDPGKAVDVLALPVAGPWMKLREAVEYALAIKPRRAFPVHDGILKQPGMVHRVPEKVLPENGIEFTPMLEGNEKEF